MTARSRGLWIINPGISATVQDSGRTGYRRHGLAAGGALDLHAFNWANKLLDNPTGAACLEIMLGGFEAEAETELTIAVTGARAPVRINDALVGHWQTHALKAGDKLTIGHARSGRIVYLALPGGIESPRWFGSQSVAPREQIEGLGPVSTSTRLLFRGPQNNREHRQVPPDFQPDYDQPLTLGVIPGYQVKEFSRRDLVRLTTSDYELTQQSDRMGYRLHGSAFADAPPGIISEGIAMGALQIPGDGQPIVLLNDGQTIGGYPKPGVVNSLDCHRLAQRVPGQTIRFVFTDLASAQNQRRLFNGYFENARWTDSGRTLTWR